MSHNVKKVFIGLSDIASMIRDLSTGFAELGIETLSAVNNSHVIQKGQCDFHIESLLPKFEWFPDSARAHAIREECRSELRNFIWKKAIKECDTFIFLYGSFLPDHKDMIELKKLGKKIIVFHVGGDIRWPDACDQEYTRYGFPFIEYSKEYLAQITIEQKLHNLRMSECLADVILSYPCAAQLSLRPYYKYWIPIKLSDFVPNTQQRERPLVIHAPSKAEFKGTRFILPVLERLKEEGVPFDYQLVQNMPNHEAIQLYQRSDILVGQCLAAAKGKQELELLACGKIVLSSIHYDYPHKHAPDCPIIDIRPETLYDTLKATILNYEGRKEIAKLGRPYVVRNHDNVRVCDQILQMLSEEPPRPDFYPTFFRNTYVPRNEKELEACNAYNRLVKGTDWYARSIISGERDGIVF